MTAPVETLTASSPSHPCGQVVLRRRRRGLARRVDAVPLVAVAFAFEGGAAQDPARQAGRRPDARRGSSTRAPAPTIRTRSRSGWPRAPSNSSFNAGPRRCRRLAQDARQACGRSLRAAAPRAGRAALRPGRGRARARADHRRPALPGRTIRTSSPPSASSPRLSRSSLWPADLGARSRAWPRSRATISCASSRGRRARPRQDRGGRRDRRRPAVRRSLDAVFGQLARARALTPVPPTTVAGRGSRVIVDLDVPQSVIRFGLDGVTWRDPDFIPGLCAQPCARRRRVHLAPVPGGAREARPRLQRRHLARELPRRRHDLGLHRHQERARGGVPRRHRRRDVRLKRTARPTTSCRRRRTTSPAPTRSASTPRPRSRTQLAQIAFEGLGIDYISRRNALVAEVTQADIRRAAERTLGDGRMLVVIAGRPTGV